VVAQHNEASAIRLCGLLFMAAGFWLAAEVMISGSHTVIIFGRPGT